MRTLPVKRRAGPEKTIQLLAEGIFGTGKDGTAAKVNLWRNREIGLKVYRTPDRKKKGEKFEYYADKEQLEKYGISCVKKY